MKTLRQRYRKFAAAGFLAGAAIFGLSLAAPAFAAGSATLSLTPSSSSVSVGSNFTVVVYENSGTDAVNAVQVGLTYPTAVLQFVSLDYSSSAFGTQAQSSGGGGSVTMARGSAPPVSGNQVVGAITFKAIAAGAGAVNFQCIYNASTCSSGNAVVRSSDNSNILTSQQNGSYTVTAPSSGGGSGGGSAGGTTGSNTSTKSTSPSASKAAPAATTPTTPASAAASAAPKISAIQVNNVSDTSVNITWQTDIPASSVVNYGTTTKYELMAQTAGLTTQHSVNLSAPNIVKGATYYFDVVSVTAGGVSANSEPQHFNTPGFDVTIKVVDKHGKPIKNATVSLSGKSAKTGANGEVVFHNIAAGNQAVVITSGGKQTKQSIQVGKFNPATKDYQKQQFSLTASGSSTPWPIYTVVALVVLAGLAVMFFGSRSGRGMSGPLGRLPGLHSAPPISPAGGPSPVIMQPNGGAANPPVAAPAALPAVPQPETQTNVVAPSGTPSVHPEAPAPGAVFSPQGHQG